LKVVWSNQAKFSLLEIYEFIAKHSMQNAVMVIETLTALGESLSNENLEYSKDIILDDERFRSVTKWSFKIVYERTKSKVIILDVFNSHQNPKKLIKLIK
jgi:plasmid stabilization system protein ParE